MSGNTNEIRTDVNAILDCIDYVCQRLDISQEDLDKAVKFVEDEVLTPGIKLAMKNVLDDRVGKNRYVWNPRKEMYEKPKTAHTAKDDWSYELDHLYFNTREEAELVVKNIESYAVDFDEVTVGYVFELMDESCSYEAEYYGWTADMILDKIQIIPFAMRNLNPDIIFREKVQVILPPPVRLKV